MKQNNRLQQILKSIESDRILLEGAFDPVRLSDISDSDEDREKAEKRVESEIKPAAEKVVEIMIKTLEKVANEDGMAESAVEAVMRTLEKTAHQFADKYPELDPNDLDEARPVVELFFVEASELLAKKLKFFREASELFVDKLEKRKNPSSRVGGPEKLFGP